MREPIKAVAYGCGRMGRLGIQLMYRKGIRIVGAIDSNPAICGMDVGEYADLGVRLGVPIRDDADAVLDECDPDIVIVALFSFVSLCEPHFNKILSRGINVLTTCDEAHYSWNTSPAVMNRLDKLAKDNGVTITGSGLLDTYWMNLAVCAGGGMQELKRIEGVTTFNTDEYGPALADAYNIGRTKEEFEALMAEQEQPDGFLMRSTNDGLCARLGLTPIRYKVEMRPYIIEEDRYSAVIDRVIPAGDCIGTAEVVTTETLQGITVQTSDIGYVFGEGEGDRCDWKLYGLPDIEVRIPNINSYILTMGNMINRIPDVINAAPGYVAVSELPALQYRHYPMELYLD